MSEALLVPVRLCAVVVPRAGSLSAAVQIDPASGAITGGPTLPGVHLRWSLPAALTTGRADASGVMRFPAVPDRWLVLRFGTPSQSASRPVRSWLINSRGATATEITGALPASPPVGDGKWLTAMGLLDGGVLPSGRSLNSSGDDLFAANGYPAWPACQNRFGFHDDLADLPLNDAYGISYVVVGWFSDSRHDPLASAPWVNQRIQALAALNWALPRIWDGTSATMDIRQWTETELRWLTGSADSHSIGYDADLSYMTGDTAPAGVGAAGVLWDVPEYTLMHGALYAVPWGNTVDTATPRNLYPSWDVAESLAEGTARWVDAAAPDPMRYYIEALITGRNDPDHWERQEWRYTQHAAAFNPIAETVPGPDDKPMALPRWYEPGLPRLLLFGVGRSLDLEDTDAKGALACRSARSLLTSWSLSATHPGNSWEHVSGVVPGSALWSQKRAALALPTTVAAIVDEAVLLDPLNAFEVGYFVAGADTMAWACTPDQAYTKAVEGAYRFGLLHSNKINAVDKTFVLPRLSWRPEPFEALAPAALAQTRWRAPWVPVSVKLNATFLAASLPATNPFASIQPSYGVADWKTCPPALLASAAPRTLSLHTVLSPVVSRTLQRSADVQQVGSAEERADLARADLMSCAIDGLDPLVRAAGLPLRMGQLSLTGLEVKDLFGRTLTLNTGVGFGHDLLARMPYAARLSLRYRSADNAFDATEDKPPVVGYLVADPVDRAIELLGANGKVWGQVRDGETRTWDAVTDPSPHTVLSALRNAMLDKSEKPLATGEPRRWNVSDLLDLIDMTRLFVDPVTGKETSWRNRLAGRPVAVVRARLVLETRDRPSNVPPIQRLPVELGNLTLGTDGLLGWFVEGQWDRLHAIDPSLEGKLGLDASIKDPTLTVRSWGTVAVRHEPVYLDENVPVDLILLLDGAADICALSRVLPFKRIAVAPEWFAAARDMVPSIRVGPLLESPTRVGTPVPPIDGKSWSLARKSEDGWLERSVREQMENELPEGRVMALAGWLRAK